MKSPRRKIYMLAGYNTISMGTGRSEFNPKKGCRPLESYIKEAGQAVLERIGGADKVDEGVIGNFMAARFNNQANLPAFFPLIDDGLKFKPAISVEGACASGGLALISAIKSVLAETADVVLALGVEVQNTKKAVYGADILAAAGWNQSRKNGHAYFFPGVFSNRAGAYYEKYGKDRSRLAMSQWYVNAIENARLCYTAQEAENKKTKLLDMALEMPLNPKKFVDHLTVLDCSKVSDGASAIAVVSEEGLKRLGFKPEEAIEVIGFAQMTSNITQDPTDLTVLETTRNAVKKALEMAGINISQLGTIELHDCFSIAGIMAIEAIGLAEPGKGIDYVIDGKTKRDGEMPINTTGGLIGWGHPTGATGVHQAVTLWEQLTGKAGDAQIEICADRPYALSINMGGDDKTLVSIVYKKG
ncbi:3-ketoacyl-CoA thiolase [Ancylomarina euxinus]|uniref:3-ketoacyl-CoA thiolase n=1 Tax=Ancylomarina euxinus TaxID=2283627 RepID=A0A425XX91_9BACT|nr:beta-ketoacyl synthase N-terminal-like domain-containing protein [Ancylomarina euxinus]MCZ4696155.1 beta-ketoacyl synthase N-terminal-like domain-containing protein [Ancylomarina euxinus]MUP16564.1 3-ketoacyl-CoA thiolase [Ancylomarina euxinus]RRG19269.1 3-ketoacyl-CoA thiolase [Ancylomarina euxinus]